MSDADRRSATPDKQLLESVWAEARGLVKRLEGSSVQRLAVQAGDYKIEIERASPAALSGPITGEAEMGQLSRPVASGAGPGLGVAPEARSASGVFGAIDDQDDGRVPVLAPLVGIFYRAAQPGAKAFIEVGDVVEVGQTVCIVEAMKLMNEVAAGEAGRVAEIVAQNGDRVEFEQVLMYLEPVGE
jgi:acetyl-CoA carboxylase biotin carboxyl carrier protein